MKNAKAGGQAGYTGYEFQIHVTVWVALELMLASRSTDVIEVEPASHEDIAAQLAVSADKAASTITVPLAASPFHIQVKHRGTHWTATDFRDLLSDKAPAKKKKAAEKKGAKKKPAPKPGASPRKRGLALLQDEATTRYVLITDATIAPKLRPFAVEDLRQECGASKLPWAAGKNIASDVVKRVSILPELGHRVLQLATEKVLGEYANVPPQKRAACRAALIESVRLRLLNKLPGAWKGEELEKTIESHGGFFPPDQNPVLPDNFGQFLAKLAERNAVLITGTAGTGKTTIARKLATDLQLEGDRAELVRGSEGLGKVEEAMDAPGRHVFLIEDPWGGYEVGPQADLWRKALPELIAKARPDKRFVITTRTSVRQTAMERLTLGLAEIEVALLPEHYSAKARVEIFEHALHGVTGRKKDWADLHRKKILERLEAPMALRRCADKIRNVTAVQALDVDSLIKDCSVEMQSETFKAEVKGRGREDVEAAIALWGWHVISNPVNEDSVKALRAVLAGGGLNPVPDVRKLHGWLGTSGWWDTTKDGLVAHPTVLAGAEALAASEAEAAERVLGAMLVGLVAAGDTAHALTLRLQAEKHLSSLAPAVEQAVAAHAEGRLLSVNDPGWRQAYSDAVKIVPAKSPVGILLKALEARDDSALHYWNPDTLGVADTAQIAASSDAKEVARRWIRGTLPDETTWTFEDGKLTTFFNKFGWDFSEDFHRLALEEIEHGNPNVPIAVIVEAALLGPAPKYEELLQPALKAYAEADEYYESHREDLRAADQREMHDANAERLEESVREGYELPGAALASIVAVRRSREGWKWLVEVENETLLYYWADSVDTTLTDDELDALEKACGAAKRHLFRKAIFNSGRSDLLTKVFADFPKLDGEQLHEAIDGLRKIVDTEEWEKVVAPNFQKIPWPQRASQLRWNSPTGNLDSNWMPGCFSMDERTALKLCQVVSNEQDVRQRFPISGAVRTLLDQLASKAEPRTAGWAVEVLATAQESVSQHLDRLEKSEIWQARLRALKARTLVNASDLNSKLVTALDDPDYRLRATAIDMLAPTAKPAIRKRILELATKDKSGPVREAAANAIAVQKWKEGELVLAGLLNDKLDTGQYSGMVGDRSEFRVAQAAARGLGRLKPLEKATQEAALEFLTPSKPSTSPREDDLEVHYALLDVLAAEDDARILPLLVQFLKNRRHNAGYKSSAYPLRYGAAWALFRHLLARPNDASSVDQSAIETAATHDDPRLAAPAMLVLGLLQPTALAPLRSAIAAGSFSAERGILALIATPASAGDSRSALRKAIGENHPALQLLDLDDQALPKDQESWKELLKTHPELENWLKTIQTDEDVFPTIRNMLRLILQFENPEEIPTGNPFGSHFATQIPTLRLG